jgi:hypothetical protein
MASPTRWTRLTKTRLRLDYTSWPRPHSHWSASDPRSQQLNQPKHSFQTRSGKLHNLFSVPHQSDRWLLPFRPMAPVRQVDSADQAGGNNKCTTKFQRASVTTLGPGRKSPPKLELKETKNLHKTKQNTMKPAKNRPAASQPKATPTRQFTRAKSHRVLAPVRPVICTSQTEGWASRDEQRAAGQLPQIHFPISRFTPLIRTRLWGY